MPDAIKVAGLREFARELKKLEGDGLTDELKDANYEVATLVVSAAKARAAGLGRMPARAADSLKPGRQAAKAVVSGGGAKTPFFGGGEFGAGQNQLRNTARGPMLGWNQFEPWRGNDTGAGYFLYPAIRSATDEIVDIMGDAVEKIARRAFPD